MSSRSNEIPDELFYNLEEGEFLGLDVCARIPSRVRIQRNSCNVEKVLELDFIEAHGDIHGGKRKLRLGLDTLGRVFVNRLYQSDIKNRPHQLGVSWKGKVFHFSLSLNEFDDVVFEELRRSAGKLVDISIGTQGWRDVLRGKKELVVESYTMTISEPDPLPELPKLKRWWPLN